MEYHGKKFGEGDEARDSVLDSKDPWALGNENGEVEEAVNPVDVKDAMKHLWELLNSGLDPETKQVVQQAYVELKQKAATSGDLK
jgi:hypothetical protein